MNWMNTIILLLLVYLAVFLQTSWRLPVQVLGTPLDLLPLVLVYAGLHLEIITLGVLAFWGGLLSSAFSLNPIGASILPLMLIGLVVHRYRDYILRDQLFAQLLLGSLACIAAGLFTLIIAFLAAPPLPDTVFALGDVNQRIGVELGGGTPVPRPVYPNLGWRTFVQLLVMGSVGGLAAPPLFRFLDWIRRNFNYPVATELAYRPDRQIKRGLRL